MINNSIYNINNVRYRISSNFRLDQWCQNYLVTDNVSNFQKCGGPQHSSATALATGWVANHTLFTWLMSIFCSLLFHNHVACGPWSCGPQRAYLMRVDSNCYIYKTHAPHSNANFCIIGRPHFMTLRAACGQRSALLTPLSYSTAKWVPVLGYVWFLKSPEGLGKERMDYKYNFARTH